MRTKSAIRVVRPLFFCLLLLCLSKLFFLLSELLPFWARVRSAVGAGGPTGAGVRGGGVRRPRVRDDASSGGRVQGNSKTEL